MVTRLYLETGVIPDVSPAFDAAWNITTSADRSVTGILKQGTTVVSKTSGAETSTSVVNVLNKQFISPPLDSNQTITGTVKGQARFLESNAGADARSQIVIRVLKSDGTIRGTLLAADTSALSSEFATSGTNRAVPLLASSPASLSSVAALTGDRLIIEIGARYHNTVATSYNHTAVFGSSAADMPENETTTTALSPWVEFSQDITFTSFARVGGLAAQVLIKTVGKAQAGGIAVKVLRSSAGLGKSWSDQVLSLIPGIWYKFDETTGTSAADSSGNSRTGAYQGTPTLGVAGGLTGITDTAVEMTDANDAWLQAPTVSDLVGRDFTHIFVCKNITMGVSAGAFLRDGTLTGGNLITLNNSGGSTNTRVNAGDYAVGTYTEWNDGAWHLVVWSVSGDTQQLWFDGVLRYSGSIPIARAFPTTAWRLNRNGTNNSQETNGTYSEWIILPSGITGSAVQGLWESMTSPPVSPGFVGWGTSI